MNGDTRSAIWLSYSSISDFQKCPRAYYYGYIYKNPKSGKKITITNKHLALGQTVHAVLDQLSTRETADRFDVDVKKLYDDAWTNVEGKKGGFTQDADEKEFKERGWQMLEKVLVDPGPLTHKAVKIKAEIDLPRYWFSEKDNLILCGKIDWLEYLEETDSVHIIDFKTGKLTEKEDSLQLPIYYLLASNAQPRPVTKMSYWYLFNDAGLVQVDLPDEKKSKERIMEVGKRIKLARQLNHFKCATGGDDGCMHCAPYEAIVSGKCIFVGVDNYGKESYMLDDSSVAF